jgi:PAS domain S-box-containing protein
MTEETFKLLCLQYSNDFISLNKPSGEFVYISPNCEKITGYKPQELIGKTPYDYFHQDEIEDIEKNRHAPILEGKENSGSEFRFRMKDGEYRWFKAKVTPLKNNDGKIDSLLSISYDITDLKAYHEELEKKESLLRQAGKLARIGAWELDLETMTPYWSPTTYEIHEVEQGLIPDLTEAINFYAPQARPTITAAIDSAIKKGIPYDLKLPFITAKGNHIWVRAIGKPEIKKGKTIRLYGVFQDINNEIEQQKQQTSLIDQLTAQKHQLQEYNQIVSHNLRSPVASLNSLLYYMENAETETEKTSILDNIKEVTKSLNELLEELVDAVKIINNNDLTYDDIDVGKVITRTQQLLEGSIKPLDAKIIVNLEAWNDINFPKLYFESIVLNLMSNALKYCADDRPPEIKITSGYENDRKILLFADNGLGIDMARYKDKVFKLHKTFHRQKPGKGLGLFMTKNQIQATGGDIFVESQVNKGTTFKIVFNTYNP